MAIARPEMAFYSIEDGERHNHPPAIRMALKSKDWAFQRAASAYLHLRKRAWMLAFHPPI